MLKSLRYRLLIWFIFSTVLIAILSFLLFHVHKTNKSEIWLSIEKLEFLRYQLLKDQKYISRFKSNDVNNESFYLTGESENLNEHYDLIIGIDSCFVDLFASNNTIFPDLNRSLVNIRSTYTKQAMLLDSIVIKNYKKGYKNFGLIGKVNTNLYHLENLHVFSSKTILDLKLAGNTYFLNNDSVNLNQILELCMRQSTRIRTKKGITEKTRYKTLENLYSYGNSFKEIGEIDTRLQIINSDLEELNNNLEVLLSQSIQNSRYSFNAYVARLNIIFALTAFFIIAFAFALSIYTSRYLVRNLEQLTKYISTLTHSNFKAKINLSLKHSTREIRQIYIEFRNMIAELHVRERQRDIALKVAQENQQRYRELADLLPQGIYETDISGNLTYVNQAWYEKFGYNPKDIEEGINIKDIIKTEKPDFNTSYSKTENNDCSALCKDGSTFPATVYSDVIKKGLKVSGRRGIVIDSTLRNKYIESLKKEAVKAITSDQHKSSFLANMSHEIRTPMNAIIGFSNMLSSDDIPEDQKTDFVHHIQSSSEMLLGLVDDIIDIAKIEAGQLNIKKSSCNATKILIDLKAKFEAFKVRMEKEKLEIELNVPEEEIQFRTDEFRLKQILSNLISNAVKFTEKGKIEIGLKQKSSRLLEFYVRDTGIGMSREELLTIFERFRRSKISEEKKISGTGLGLAIAKNLVELLDGKMWVQSELNKGTCFTFEMPYLRINEEIKENAPTSTSNNYNWHDKTILIAEDDEKGYNLLEMGLKQTNVNIIHAKNGKEAIEALNFYDNIDIVLMDMQMPVISGMEAIIRIKEKHSNLPIIVQTAHAMEGDREKCLASGCDDYTTKPLHIPDLLAKIDQFIDRAKSNTKVQSGSQNANIQNENYIQQLKNNNSTNL
jgi:PAS domain S-box-containing protein